MILGDVLITIAKYCRHIDTILCYIYVTCVHTASSTLKLEIWFCYGEKLLSYNIITTSLLLQHVT